MNTVLKELAGLEVKRQAAVARYLDALQGYYPAAAATHEILIHHDGSVIVAVSMPEDDETAIALGEQMAHIGTELLLETDISIVLSLRPASTF